MTFNTAGSTDGSGLPGVIQDGPAPSDSGNPASKPASPAAGAAPAKDAPASPAPEGEATPADAADATEPTGDVPAGEETPAEDAEPLTLAGKTFKSKTDAENYVKAQDGRVKALTGRIGEYASSANAWMTYGKQLESQLALKNGQPAGEPGNAQPTTTDPAPKTAPSDPNAWLDGLNWDFYEQLAREQGPQYAGFWLAEKIAERQDRMLEERLAARFAPIDQREQLEALQHKTSTLFSGIAAKVDDAGNPLYPELHTQDQEAGKALVDIWATLPDALRYTERGVVLAIGEFRLQRGVPPRPAAGTASGASQPVLTGLRKQQAAGSTAITGEGTPRSAGKGSAGADINRAIREAGLPVGHENADTRLGFYA